jgi:hypothetical protein
MARSSPGRLVFAFFSGLGRRRSIAQSGRIKSSAAFRKSDGGVTNPQPDRDSNVNQDETLDLPITFRRVGPYVLKVLLGSGDFGEVWLATREGELAHTQLAVKLPHASHVDLAAG